MRVIAVVNQKGGKSAGKAMKATFKKMDVAPKNGGKKA